MAVIVVVIVIPQARDNLQSLDRLSTNALVRRAQFQRSVIVVVIVTTGRTKAPLPGLVGYASML